MGEDPGAIREEIEQTRAELGDTMDALGYKTDVKGRARDKVDDLKSKVTGTADDMKSKVTGTTSRVSDATPSGGDVKEGAKKAAGLAQENPLGLALGSVAIGFVAGLLIPSTRVEDERIGQVADQVKGRAVETGQEALERGKQVAQQAAQSAKESAQETSREQADELRGSARERAEQTRQEVRPQG